MKIFKNVQFHQKGVSTFGVILVVLGLLFVGVLATFNNYPVNPAGLPSGYGGLCCDSGDGPNCNVVNDAEHPPLTFISSQYGTQQYGLLKSSITLREGGYHLKDSGQTFQGQPIILNTTDGFQTSKGKYECGQGKMDQLWSPSPNGPQCIPIPHEELVYECVKNCFVPKNCYARNPTVSCYGDKTTVYNVYFRLSDIPTPGIPDVIKNCQNAIIGTLTTPNPAAQPTTTNLSPYPEHKSLQLHTFDFSPYDANTNTTAWLSPYCKPIIHLYPQQKEHIHVTIAPKSTVLYTIPSYPSTGWDVIAYPDSKILYQGTTYNELFYEAQIPDSLLPQVNTGYVIRYNDLSTFFNNTLPTLGLTQQEQKEFSTYWLKVLPNSPYYRISVIPQTTLNLISPLTITPSPDVTIRVTLHFEPIDTFINIPPPVLTPIQRKGFVVSEWGGIFKKDKKHSFSCFM